ncbi:MAG: glutathione S-transferase N-terminal domain-containing protein [Candidatus Diapherotrites archaeon]|uniref:Glutathione S-transferase N-terminal domain-containing protein n=1 Tax=Candidatus Iainarchaeum sp. TaxID=3101447 RepID=A0A938YTQ9_9ARCH|nr:glutathione S-transferase N-terminal domain-containing protein [Candidatus Diapherotrites archaeon]
MSKVIVYSTPTCPFCTMAEDFFRQNSVGFEHVDVSSSPERLQEMMGKSGQTGVPVIDIDGKIIVGFDEMAIRAALKL